MLTMVAKSSPVGVTTGSTAYGGIVYKTWNDGKNGLVLSPAPFYYNRFNGLYQWQNGLIEGNQNLSFDNGLANTKTMWDTRGGAGYYIMGSDAWHYTRKDFTYWSQNHGYGDWWVPAYNEMLEIMSSSVAPSNFTGSIWTSTDAGVDGDNTSIGYYCNGLGGQFFTSSYGGNDARIWMIREF